MQPKELADLVKRLRNAYGLRQVDAEIVEFIFSKCGKIPSKAVGWIEERFQTLYDKFPSRLHGAITSCWWDYLREHPEEKAKEFVSCRYCEDGLLFLKKSVSLYGDVDTCFVATCGHCRQRSDEKSTPMLTLQQATQLGYSRWTDEEKPRMDYSNMGWWHELALRITRKRGIGNA